MGFGKRYKILNYNVNTRMARVYDKKNKDTFSRPIRVIAEAIRNMK